MSTALEIDIASELCDAVVIETAIDPLGQTLLSLERDRITVCLDVDSVPIRLVGKKGLDDGSSVELEFELVFFHKGKFTFNVEIMG